MYIATVSSMKKVCISQSSKKFDNKWWGIREAARGNFYFAGGVMGKRLLLLNAVDAKSVDKV